MRGETSLGRGIATIVVAGVVLGTAYNGAGLLSRPSRGIPWVAAKNDLPDLDSLSARAGNPASGAPGDSLAPAPAPSAGSTATPSGALAPSADPGQPASRTKGKPAQARREAPKPPEASQPTAKPTEPPGQTPAQVPGQTPAQAQARPPLPFIPESDQPVQVKLATAKLLFDAGAALFLDAREPSDFQAGHIPGALQMTREDALDNPDRVKALPVRGRPIVTYCDGGPCEASLELARALVGAGYRKVLVFSGGYPEWVAAGHPVERGGNGR